MHYSLAGLPVRERFGRLWLTRTALMAGPKQAASRPTASTAETNLAGTLSGPRALARRAGAVRRARVSAQVPAFGRFCPDPIGIAWRAEVRPDRGSSRP